MASNTILGLDLGTNSIGWALIKQDFEEKEGEIESLTVPLCMSTVLPLSKTAPMCIPRNVLNELRRFGKYRTKDFRRWIGNCEIYDKVNVQKTETPQRVDLAGF